MSQNNNHKRSLHCSFCDDEGHTINNCRDNQIGFLVKEFNESISLDIKCNLKMKYANYILSLYSVAEIRIIGYQEGLSMNKLSKTDFINEVIDEYYNKSNNKHCEIIDNMNNAELNYFAKKIADSSKIWNSRKISLNKVKQLLDIDNTVINPEQVTTTTDSSDTDSSDTDSSDTDSSDTEINLQFYYFPLVDTSIFDDLSPALKNSLHYMYYLSVGAVLLNLYVLCNNGETSN
jgi:hypothetical protein